MKNSSEEAVSALKTVSNSAMWFSYLVIFFPLNVHCKLRISGFGLSAYSTIATYIYNTMTIAITMVKFVRYPILLSDLKFHKNQGLWLLFLLLHSHKQGKCWAYHLCSISQMNELMNEEVGMKKKKVPISRTIFPVV